MSAAGRKWSDFGADGLVECGSRVELLAFLYVLFPVFHFRLAFQCSIWAFFLIYHFHFYSSASASFQSQTHQQLLTPSLLSVGDDPFWEAVNLWYGATGDIEWYDPGQVTTRGGALVITMDSTSTTQAGMTNGGFL